MTPVDSERAAPAQWPTTADGWQLVPIGRALFPGGHSAYRVNSPHYHFFFAMTFEPLFGDPCRAVISSFGRSAARGPWRYLLITPDAISKAQAVVRERLLTHPLAYHDRWIDAVEFRLGDDVPIEIF